MDYEMTTAEEARKAAAMALENGMELAARVGKQRTTGREMARLSMNTLGRSLANPAAFWAGAAVIEGTCDTTEIEILKSATKYAAARLAAGDYEFTRESLIGQAQWCSVLAVKTATRAEIEDKPERVALLLKLALQAQRQAATALATAAALNKLNDCTGVAMAD